MNDTLRDRVTAVLAEAGRSGVGDREALDRLVPLVYDELRRMARAQLARDGHHPTLDTTGLVHEAYVKLVQAEHVPVRNRAYFFGAAARAMRQVLVDAARHRQRLKRGGGEIVRSLDADTIAIEAVADEVLVLDAALDRLSKRHPRSARVLECRCFGGLGVEETADALRLAARTVNRDLAFAKAWLRRELTGEAGATDPAPEAPA